MKLRTLFLTVAVLVAACIAAYFVRRPTAPIQDARVNQPVLAADVADKAAQVRLTDQGKTATFKKQADGSWLVSDYFDFPADFTKLGQFIADFTTDIKVLRLVTSRVDRLARLEFKETSLTLLDAAGKELWRASFGKYADDGGRYLRYGDEPKAYQATLNAGLDAQPRNWVDSTLLHLKPEDIAGIEIGFAEGPPITASRPGKEEAWNSPEAPAGKQLKADRIASVLRGLVSLHFTETSEPDAPGVAAAQAHSRTLKLGTFAGTSYTLVLGRKPEEKKPRAKPAEADAPPAAATPEEEKPAESKPAEPEFETIPAGPVYVHLTSSDEKASVNALMQKRAFQVYEGIFTALPGRPDEWWEDKPAPAPAAQPDNPPKPAEPGKETPPAQP